MIRITLPQEYEERAGVKDLVDRLMGNNPAHRFAFIQENAGAAGRGGDRRVRRSTRIGVS